MNNLDQIKIFIPGQPLGKERARSRIITSKTGAQFTSHYTPKKTRANENKIRSLSINAMNGKKPTRQPVSLTLTIVFEIPKSWPKWKQELAVQGEILPTVKPDSDNIEKSVKDGFNGVVWVDDCQVVRSIKTKRYGLIPGVLAEIQPLSSYPAQISKKTDLILKF